MRVEGGQLEPKTVDGDFPVVLAIEVLDGPASDYHLAQRLQVQHSHFLLLVFVDSTLP